MQADSASRFLSRCRRAGDARPVLEVLGEILSPADAQRFADTLRAVSLQDASRLRFIPIEER